MSDIFNVLLFQNTLRTATPVVLAALGCLMTQHVNITEYWYRRHDAHRRVFRRAGQLLLRQLGGGTGLCHCCSA